MNVLITSAGRRVELIQQIRKTFRRNNQAVRIFAADRTNLSPAVQVSDGWARVPDCTHPDYTDVVLEFCKQNDVKWIIPTIDTELLAFAIAQAKFKDVGITVNISSRETIEIARDKAKTNEVFRRLGLTTPKQYGPADIARAQAEIKFPWMLKPKSGSSSIGIEVARNIEQVKKAVSLRDDIVIEQLITGEEYTVNFFVTRDGKCPLQTPHRRLQTRTGEVSKGLTVRNAEIMRLTKIFAEGLPGCFGINCVQLIVAQDGSVNFFEMNGRVGGGLPLAIEAGAPFLELFFELEPDPNSQDLNHRWQDDLYMLRYDSSVFVRKSQIEQS